MGGKLYTKSFLENIMWIWNYSTKFWQLEYLWGDLHYFWGNDDSVLGILIGSIFFLAFLIWKRIKIS